MAKDVGGAVNAGSGAFWSRKGDIRADGLSIEAKWTSKMQFTVKAAVLEKIFREAVIDGRIPVQAIELNKKDYGIVLWDDLLELLGIDP